VTIPQISQRDLRQRSKEIMDAVQRGESFTVTRDGHEIGQLVPLRHRGRFVPRERFALASRTGAAVDVERFRADVDAVVDQDVVDPYDG
jgi:prevent-host-death family protein